MKVQHILLRLLAMVSAFTSKHQGSWRGTDHEGFLESIAAMGLDIDEENTPRVEKVLNAARSFYHEFAAHDKPDETLAAFLDAVGTFVLDHGGVWGSEEWEAFVEAIPTNVPDMSDDRKNDLDILMEAAGAILPGVHLQLTEDDLSIVLDCQENPETFLAYITKKVAAFNLAEPPSATEIRARLQKMAEQDAFLRGAVLLEGIEPVPPEDGYIDWAQDFFNTGFVVDLDTGRVDYRKRAAQVTVSKNQLLATVQEPKQGEEGEDLFGKIIKVPKAMPARITTGQNVSHDDSTNEFRSGTEGRIRWNGLALAVDTVLTIEGNVDLETGDIDHPGALVVKRDVLEGASIKAVGDIEVCGVIEAANIQTGGNLTVHCGITGHEGRRILVAGDIHAKFILDADVEANGDIVVEKEILNSTVKTQSGILIPQGRVVTSEIIALSDIEIGQAGSDACAPASIVAGEDYRLGLALQQKEDERKRAEEDLKRLKETIAPQMPRINLVSGNEREKAAKLLGAICKMDPETLKKNLDRLQQALRPLIPKWQALPKAKIRAVAHVLEAVVKLEQGMSDLKQEMEDLRTEARKRDKPTILIHKFLHPDITLGLSTERFINRETMEGPIRAIYARGEVRLVEAHEKPEAKR